MAAGGERMEEARGGDSVDQIGEIGDLVSHLPDTSVSIKQVSDRGS